MAADSRRLRARGTRHRDRHQWRNFQPSPGANFRALLTSSSCRNQPPSKTWESVYWPVLVADLRIIYFASDLGWLLLFARYGTTGADTSLLLICASSWLPCSAIITPTHHSRNNIDRNRNEPANQCSTRRTDPRISSHDLTSSPTLTKWHWGATSADRTARSAAGYQYERSAAILLRTPKMT